MKRRELLALICLGVCLGVLLPGDVFATKTNMYGAKEVSEIGKNLQSFMFDIVVPYVAGIVGGYQTVKAFMANNFQSMGMFALLTASSFVMPPFLNGVFGTSMLLP